MFTRDEIQILIEGIAAVNRRLQQSSNTTNKTEVARCKKENLLVGSILEKLNQNLLTLSK